jgi:hypothetical protein
MAAMETYIQEYEVINSDDVCPRVNRLTDTEYRQSDL